jgi:hypothetical protein
MCDVDRLEASGWARLNEKAPVSGSTVACHAAGPTASTPCHHHLVFVFGHNFNFTTTRGSGACLLILPSLSHASTRARLKIRIHIYEQLYEQAVRPLGMRYVTIRSDPCTITFAKRYVNRFCFNAVVRMEIRCSSFVPEV